MAGKTDIQSTIQKAWEDSWKWLHDTKWGWIVPIIVGGSVSAIFIGDSVLERAIAGALGAIAAILLVVGIAFIIHCLFITPSRLRKENRRKFIRSNASYLSRIFGNKEKKKYLTILEIVKSMVKIENEVTDNLATKPIFTTTELLEIQSKLSEQTGIETMPVSKAEKLLIKGTYVNKIVQKINKMDLQIMGDKLTENQIEFLVKTKSVLDNCGVGLLSGLGGSLEYTELLRQLSEEIPDINDSTPAWILSLLIIPSGLNSGYLLWSRLPAPSKNKLTQSPFNMSNFLSERETGIKELVEYAKQEIEKL
ncbi:MAG: hypothetical protein HYX91_03835 [Chloroflexi bacterium]|nr:hypothetical protein [Chloroflexota bacterium]